MPQKIQTPEIRCGDCCLVEDTRTIEGYALVFNQWSTPQIAKINGVDSVFKEFIMPGAVDGLIDQCDVIATFNHEEDEGILARSVNGVGSLKLSIDEYGLKYSFEAPDTTLGEDTVKSMKRGDITGSSFQFVVAKGGDKWEKRADGIYYRTVNKILALLDISVVIRPAYTGATASTRSLEAIEEITIKEDLENYYTALKNEYV